MPGHERTQRSLDPVGLANRGSLAEGASSAPVARWPCRSVRRGAGPGAHPEIARAQTRRRDGDKARAG